MIWPVAYVRRNALTLALLLLCGVAVVGLFHDSVKKVPAPVAVSPVVSITAEGPPPELKEDVLDLIIPELKLEDRPTLESAIQTIARLAPCNISVNWRNLQTAGVDRDSLVAAAYGPYRNIAVRQALSHLWKNDLIGFSVQDNVILIDTRDNLARYTVTLVYNVRDLIDAMIAFSHETHQEAADMLTKLMTDVIDSDSWRDNGGNVGSIREMMGLLVVTQTPENHRSVVQLLDSLRHRGSIQPHIPGPIARPPSDASATQPSGTADATISPANQTETMIYNVRDLIDALIVNARPQVSADFPGESAHSVAAGGLEAVLTTMIDSDSWRENGGNAGSIRETMSLLIVQQTPENQKAVQQMLEAMRAELKAPTPATTVVPR